MARAMPDMVTFLDTQYHWTDKHLFNSLFYGITWVVQHQKG